MFQYTQTCRAKKWRHLFHLPIHSETHPPPSASRAETRAPLRCVGKWQTHCTTDIAGQWPTQVAFWRGAPASPSHTPSPSGRGVSGQPLDRAPTTLLSLGPRPPLAGQEQARQQTPSQGLRSALRDARARAFQRCPFSWHKRHSTEENSFGGRRLLTLTFMSLIPLLPHSTAGMPSHVGLRSLCRLDAFL